GLWTWMDTSDKKIQNTYIKNYRDKVRDFEQRFTAAGADTLSIATDQPYFTALHQFFRKRINRR
ncbi:MAG TPA: DUF58 domain-containing protein, partial [Bacteroidetes bacterium]|nr:DUF58 domain-containing protein [Bacteroidota bacterium]